MSFYSEYGILLEAEQKEKQAFEIKLSEAEFSLSSEFQNFCKEDPSLLSISTQCRKDLNSIVYRNQVRLHQLEVLKHKQRVMEAALERAQRPIVDISDCLLYTCPSPRDS